MSVALIEDENKLVSSEKEKVILLVDEQDILKMAEKIQINKQEDKYYFETLDDFFNEELKTSNIIKIGSTPIAMQIVGAKNSDLIITQGTLTNSMNSENIKIHGHTTGHDINVDFIKALPYYLRNPTIILQGNKPDSLVLVTDVLDKKDRNIIIPISLNKNRGFYIVNSVDSIYGKNNIRNYMEKAFANNTVLAMHKNKAEKMLRSIGCQSSKENTFISFDNSIAYTARNVKIPEQKLLHEIDNKINSNDSISNSEQNVTLEDLSKWQESAEKEIDDKIHSNDRDLR